MDHQDLRGRLDMTARWAQLAALASYEEDAEEDRKKMRVEQIEAVRLLGEQLRQLP